MPPSTQPSIGPFLKVLQDVVSRLLETIPCASPKDASTKTSTITRLEIGNSLCSLRTSIHPLFQPESQAPALVNNVPRGENGTDLVTMRLEAISKPSVVTSDELKSASILIRQLVDLLLQTAKEEMLRRDVAAVTDVIPTFNILVRKLIESAAKLRDIRGPASHESISAHALLTGIEAGVSMVQHYEGLAHSSDLCLASTSWWQ